MEKVFVVQRVATQLFAAENAVDSAMSEASTLMTEMLKARKDLGLSATVADGAFAKVAEAIKALGDVRSTLVAAHGELNDAKLRIGVRTKLAGYEDKGNSIEQAGSSTLRAAS
ncbi:MAG TPA: hypothetical protein VGS12_11490 [Caulobacteraceae bacterium]|nr:hypothetical protein [Caulobacteraceae bacterium]